MEGLDHRKILIKNVCEDSKVLRDTRISYPVLPTCHTPQLKSHIATPKGTKNLLNFFAGSKKTRENCPKISDFSSILGMQSAKNISKIHQDSLNTTIGSHSYLAAPLKKTKLVKTSSKNSWFSIPISKLKSNCYYCMHFILWKENRTKLLPASIAVRGRTRPRATALSSNRKSVFLIFLCQKGYQQQSSRN